MNAISTAPDPVFAHPALFYASDAEYLAGLVPFVTDGLDLDHPVAVAVPGPRLDLLRDALGGTARHVTMLDMTREGRNPGRIIARVLRRFADARTDRHVRIVGEPIWAGRSGVEYPACAQHEALINAAFTGRDVTILCPYDTVALDAEVIADARETHPVVWEGDRRYASDRYAPDRVVARYNAPLPDAADGAFAVAGPADLSPARRFAAQRGRLLGLTERRLADVELIAGELVTNSLVHTAGPCRLGVWAEDGHLVCEVRDGGRLTDPLAGRRPPEDHGASGLGLLLVNDLADLVRLHTAADGTTVRALLRL
ncbi:anti-sigma regulatory factor (Ser/Thr protein kinase) [Saccharothrix saharensis]|uniref:Anti-sigma regulatory factor (Ser/Thr protein kinase) n=1 Tax=Saccharothrix saharensis TaxID=571190 RepID=A0A543J6D0_9PSEU|nr:sensor histidine kinase [Saccharothrix saharensis]TQM78371.1 anti-sigma regulatory factor (Ser/Thr protein kinase) [Saccharothrix saharensis]